MGAFLCTIAIAIANVAYQDDTVRFTVIADGVIRMEYSPDGRFNDSPSLLAIERGYDDVDYKVRDKGGKIYLTTPKMQMTYKKNSGDFNAGNLKIVSGKELQPHFEWYPGKLQ